MGQVLEFGTVVGYSPGSNEVSAEPEESPLLEDVTRERLMENVTDLEH
jgi:hypothetical protein